MSGIDPYRTKLQKLIQQKCSASILNDTKWKKVVEMLKDFSLSFRIKRLTVSDVSEWNTGFCSVPGNYIEVASIGPILALEIEYLEVDTIERKHKGKLVAPEIISHTEEIEKLLSAFKVSYVKDAAIIRIQGHVMRNEK
jgi:hypothetical protein